MPFQLPDGTLLAPDTAFTLNDIQYPANFLRLSTAAEKEALGITWIDPSPTWDQRFYWGYDQDGQLIPKDHAELIEYWKQQTRDTANKLLQPTDWIIIREADNGTAADPTLKTWREEIRLAAGVKVAAIESTVDTTELAAYVTSTEYSHWTNDPFVDTPNPAVGVA